MNNKIIDKILHNWSAKIICLITAIFIYIFYQASLIQKRTFIVPLKVQENGIVMHIGNIPSSIPVIVRASENDINAVLPSDITALINLDTITKNGEHKVLVNLQISDKLLEMNPFEIRLKEESILVNVEKKAYKYVKLNPSVVGEVAYGFKVENVSLNPSFIEIEGPQSLVESIDEVLTTRINVMNAQNSFSSSVECLELSKMIKIIDEGPYIADIKISPIQVEKQINNISVKFQNLPELFELENSEFFVNLIIGGNLTDIEELKIKENFILADLSEILKEGEFIIPLKFNFPPKIKILSKSTENITINVKNKKNDGFSISENEENLL